MGLFRKSPDQQRQRLLAEAPAGPLRDYLTSPLPQPATPVGELALLAVDVETTGLDPEHDKLLSIGWVPVDGTTIRLTGAGHLVVRSEASVGQSAVLHRITDDELAGGVPVDQALGELLGALQGRALLAHHALLETGFVGRACQQVWGSRPPFAVVDTMHLQYRLLSRGFDDEPPQGALRLEAARDQYGLPRYQAHNALVDALACAELYLAQVAELSPSQTLKTLGS